MSNKLSVVGLGKLGLPLAACYADAGMDVLGVDVNNDVIDQVNSGTAPFFEPGLSELLAKHGGKTLRATREHSRAIRETDTTVILVATPSKPDGSFSNEYVESALTSLAEALAASDKLHHLFVISSTVVPGSTDSSFIPLIERVSGRKLNEGFSVCFDPDFVALGNVIKDFQNPDMVFIGESDPDTGAKWAATHARMCRNNPPVSRMSLINAELAKVCLNVYITTKITFANMLANLCERIPGADVDAITKAIGRDKRISPYYLSGGLSFGGPCFPRDTVAYRTIAGQYGMDATLVDAVDAVNRWQDEHLADLVRSLAKRAPAGPIGILGLAFKADTPVVLDSPGLTLARSLVAEGARLVVFDPWAMDAARRALGDSVTYAESVQQVIDSCPFTVLAYRSKIFREALKGCCIPDDRLVLDCWRQLSAGDVNPKLRILGMGRFMA